MTGQQTTPDPEPSWLWKLGEWLLILDARWCKLHRAVICTRVYAMRFRMENEEQERDEQRRRTYWSQR